MGIVGGDTRSLRAGGSLPFHTEVVVEVKGPGSPPFSSQGNMIASSDFGGRGGGPPV